MPSSVLPIAKYPPNFRPYDADGFVVAYAVTASNAGKDVWLLMVAFDRNEGRDRFANNLLGCIAEELFCSPVPSHNNSVDVLTDDGIIRRLYDGGNLLRCVQG
jgi:hypothetical protein